jgi:hypothetical protein
MTGITTLPELENVLFSCCHCIGPGIFSMSHWLGDPQLGHYGNMAQKIPRDLGKKGNAPSS